MGFGCFLAILFVYWEIVSWKSVMFLASHKPQEEKFVFAAAILILPLRKFEYFFGQQLCTALFYLKIEGRVDSWIAVDKVFSLIYFTIGTLIYLLFFNDLVYIDPLGDLNWFVSQILLFELFLYSFLNFLVDFFTLFLFVDVHLFLTIPIVTYNALGLKIFKFYHLIYHLHMTTSQIVPFYWSFSHKTLFLVVLLQMTQSTETHRSLFGLKI